LRYRNLPPLKGKPVGRFAVKADEN